MKGGSPIVKLYSTNCPKCNVLKKKLERLNLKYEEETSVDKMLELGFTEAPMLEADGQYMDFPTAIRWLTSQQ